MADILNDARIQQLIIEPKPVPWNYQALVTPKPKKGHAERELSLQGQAGGDFRIIVRQSLLNPLDFSAILAYFSKKSNVLFRLRRYNGKSHEHSNTLEGQGPFYDFHIHKATERYQQAGVAEDSFAEVTDRYGDLNGALGCLSDDCGMIHPEGNRTLFRI